MLGKVEMTSLTRWHIESLDAMHHLLLFLTMSLFKNLTMVRSFARLEMLTAQDHEAMRRTNVLRL